MLSAQGNHTTNEEWVLSVVLELSGKCWKMGMNDGRRNKPTIYNAMAESAMGRIQEVVNRIEGQKEKWGLSKSGRVVVAYEAGQDGFWISRELEKRGYEGLVIDPASVPVERQAKRAKTDRLDTMMLLSALQGYLRGEMHRMRVVRQPSAEEEDRRQMVRDRGQLQLEIGQHKQRMMKLLRLVGCWEKIDAGFEKRLLEGQVKQHNGTCLPVEFARRLREECKRLSLVQKQFEQLEKSMLAQMPPEVQEKVLRLQRLKGVGQVGAMRLVLELFWRRFENRRQLGACVGLVSQPYDSGTMRVDQGISKQGNRRIRALLVEMAWMWLRYQPQSGLSRWFVERTKANAANKRGKRIAIVAVARKLVIALWRYVENGVIPEGALMKAG